MRRFKVVLVAVLFVAMLLNAGCTGKANKAAVEAARASVASATAALDRSDAIITETYKLNVETAEAPSEVKGRLAKAALETSAAAASTRLAHESLAKISDPNAKQTWGAVITELDSLVDAHAKASAVMATTIGQLAATGHAEAMLPAAQEGLEGAGGLVDATLTGGLVLPGTTGFSMPELDDAKTTFLDEQRSLTEAHKLEPAAGLNKMAAFCGSEAKACDLLDASLQAFGDGNAAKAKRLWLESAKLHGANQKMPKPDIFDPDYSTRYKPIMDDEKQHAEKLKVLVQKASGA
jgi:hypothetical protein